VSSVSVSVNSLAPFARFCPRFGVFSTVPSSSCNASRNDCNRLSCKLRLHSDLSTPSLAKLSTPPTEKTPRHGARQRAPHGPARTTRAGKRTGYHLTTCQRTHRAPPLSTGSDRSNSGATLVASQSGHVDAAARMLRKARPRAGDKSARRTRHRRARASRDMPATCTTKTRTHNRYDCKQDTHAPCTARHKQDNIHHTHHATHTRHAHTHTHTHTHTAND